MRITKPQKYILFVLGKSYDKINQKYKEQPIEISISKAAFIELAKSAKLTEKRVRSLYKNLETLEKNKLITYYSKSLALTEKGLNIYEKIDHHLTPFLDVLQIINREDMLKYTNKTRTILKS